jgi:hypothetical protein
VVYGSRYEGSIALALLLLVPTALENWIRGCASPALLRNGRGTSLMKLNAVQAFVTITALVFVRHLPLEWVIIVVLGLRAAVASFSLLLLRSLVPRGTYRVPLQAALIGTLSYCLTYAWGSFLPFSASSRAVVEGLSYTCLFYAGMRWLVLRDQETLHLAHRITGSRARLFARLLPPPSPLLNT